MLLNCQKRMHQEYQIYYAKTLQTGALISHITSTTSNSFQNMFECNSNHQNQNQMNQQQFYHLQLVLIHLQTPIRITN